MSPGSAASWKARHRGEYALISAQFRLRRSNLSLGACFYAIYAASLYENSNEWFLILANALVDGIGFGLFFATEERCVLSVLIGYPEPSKRGRYISTWVFMMNLGLQVVEGAY
ncbi:hypothetical protein BDZ89DRAFT_1125169 [Hymenopellis radicata]|nr:hypothetical protein BDZ89DRAFT_1125169 [Hymenopellis radicata]